MSADDREPGFMGLVAAGATPAQAWQLIRDDLAADDSGALAILRDLASDEPGRAALEHSRQRWAAHGLAPPWDGLL